jgi:hypothetical protein
VTGPAHGSGAFPIGGSDAGGPPRERRTAIPTINPTSRPTPPNTAQVVGLCQTVEETVVAAATGTNVAVSVIGPNTVTVVVDDVPL